MATGTVEVWKLPLGVNGFAFLFLPVSFWCTRLDITEAFTEPGVWKTEGMLAAQAAYLLWEYTLCPHSQGWVLIPQSISLPGCLSLSYCEGADWKTGGGAHTVLTTAGCHRPSRSSRCRVPPAVPRLGQRKHVSSQTAPWAGFPARSKAHLPHFSWRNLENFSATLEDWGIKYTWFLKLSVALALQGTSTEQRDSETGLKTESDSWKSSAEPHVLWPHLSPLPTSHSVHGFCRSGTTALSLTSGLHACSSLTPEHALSTPDPEHLTVSCLSSKPHLRCHSLQEAFLIARVWVRCSCSIFPKYPLLLS